MRSINTHLTAQELNSLLFGPADPANGNANAAQMAQQHLTSCADCKSLANRYCKVDALLQSLAPRSTWATQPSIPGDGCPPEELWPHVASGLIGSEETTRLVSHAARCDWCGPLFKESMEQLKQEMTLEEQEALRRLPSASRDWQSEVAARLQAKSSKPKNNTGFFRKLISKAPWVRHSIRHQLVYIYLGSLAASLMITAFFVFNTYRFSRQLEKQQATIYALTERIDEISRRPGNQRADLPSLPYTPSMLSATTNPPLIEQQLRKAIKQLHKQLEKEQTIAQNLQNQLQKTNFLFIQVEEQPANTLNQKLHTAVSKKVHSVGIFPMGFADSQSSSLLSRPPFTAMLPPTLSSNLRSIVTAHLLPQASSEMLSSEITVPRGIRSIQFSLQVPMAVDTNAKIELLNKASEVLYTLHRVVQRSSNDNVIVATIGKEYLAAGDYVLRVTISESQLSPLLYSFRVLGD